MTRTPLAPLFLAVALATTALADQAAIERELATARAALEAKRWKECEQALGRAGDELERLRTPDPVLAGQLGRLSWILRCETVLVEAERRWAEGDQPHALSIIQQAREELASSSARHPDPPEVARLRARIDQVERAVQSVPPNPRAGETPAPAAPESRAAREERGRQMRAVLDGPVLLIAIATLAIMSLGAVVSAQRRRERDATAPPPGPWSALGRSLAAVLGLFVLGQLLPGVVLGIAMGRMRTAELMEKLVELAPHLLAVTAIAALGLAVLFKRVGWLPDDPPAADPRRATLWSLGCALLAIGGGWLLIEAQESVYPFGEQEVLTRAFAQPGAFLWIGVVLLAPLGEEVLFRRVVYGNLRAGLGVGAAVGISALAFALVHGNPSGLPAYTLIGVALALAYEKTGRLWVPVAIHALNNLISGLMVGSG